MKIETMAVEGTIGDRDSIERIRDDFPILKLQVSGKPLVYLDNAASSQMPQPVIDRIVRYQTQEHSNIHRAVHYLSELATREYEAARVKVQHFLNAKESREIIFTRGTTEAINLVMHGYGRTFIGKGDEIILSALEHHANIVPWQMLANEKGAVLRVIPMNDAGELRIDEFEALFNAKTKFLGKGADACIECAWHRESGQDHDCLRAQPWRAGSA